METYDSRFKGPEIDALLDEIPSLAAAVAEKVDKVQGKGLSENDFTNADKDKLDGVADGAQENIIEGVSVNGVLVPPVNKVVDIQVSGSDPNAVLFTQQTLTPEQKAQARENIGAGISDFSADPIVALTTPQVPDGTLIAILASGNTVTIDLNHNHPQYPKYEYLDDESEMPEIPDESTLYLIGEESE